MDHRPPKTLVAALPPVVPIVPCAVAYPVVGLAMDAASVLRARNLYLPASTAASLPLAVVAMPPVPRVLMLFSSRLENS
jgi:hypothetical protein